jgi:hypothetical protein
VVRNAVDGLLSCDERHRHGRRSRVVLARTCRRQVVAMAPKAAWRRRWQTRVHRGERDISRKPLRRGGRLLPACTCGFRARAISFCARAPGAAATRPSLRPHV